MIVFRIIGNIFVGLSLLVLGLGLWLWLSGENVVQPAGKLWFQTSFNSLNNAQVIVQRHLQLPAVWEDWVVPFLHLPAWEALISAFLALLIIGGLLMTLGRKSQRRRHSSFE